MKKRMILTVMTISLAALVLFAGCAKKEEPAPAPDESQTTQTPDVTPETPAETPETPAETPDTSAGQADALAALLGKTDADVVMALGEGTPTADESGAVLARDYETKLYDKNATMSVSYEADKVSMIVAFPTEGDYAAWTELVTGELGEPAQTSADNSEGGDSKSLTWTRDGGVMITLREAFGAVSLEFFVGA